MTMLVACFNWGILLQISPWSILKVFNKFWKGNGHCDEPNIKSFRLSGQDPPTSTGMYSANLYGATVALWSLLYACTDTFLPFHLAKCRLFINLDLVLNLINSAHEPYAPQRTTTPQQPQRGTGLWSSQTYKISIIAGAGLHLDPVILSLRSVIWTALSTFHQLDVEHLQRFNTILDQTTPYHTYRWVITGALLLLYFIRVWLLAAFYIVTVCIIALQTARRTPHSQSIYYFGVFKIWMLGCERNA
jgi:hypothetical protein